MTAVAPLPPRGGRSYGRDPCEHAGRALGSFKDFAQRLIFDRIVRLVGLKILQLASIVSSYSIRITYDRYDCFQVLATKPYTDWHFRF